MAKSFDYLLLGGGTSCGYAAAAIREIDGTGTIGIVSADSEPPYDRPPFSKYFLWNDERKIDDFHSKDESFYPANRIELLLERTATSIDALGHTVALEGGEQISYGKLLYALGSDPRRPGIPGGETAWLLRTAADSAQIRQAASKGAKAVLVGAGYIGAELAASLIGRGVEVTLIELGDRVWSRFPSVASAEAIQRQLQSMGATIVTGEGASKIDAGKRVETSSGRVFEGDFVVAGIGAVPRASLAREAGLQASSLGVSADATLRSSDADIWVAGDVADYRDATLGKTYRAEHHLHAKWTGEAAGRAMAGHAVPYLRAPHFFSDVGALSMNLRGFPEHADQSWVLGDPEIPIVTEVFLFADGRVAGLVDVREDYKAQDPICDLFEKLILEGANALPMVKELEDPNFDVLRLAELL
jgi:3-phenylpropionate/trans-cinnamate dioxygenase ferredoxin reductase subunit